MDIRKVKNLLEDLIVEVKRADKEDLDQYGIKKLRNGLTLEEIKKKYTWILDADIRDAIIGKDSRGIIWYDGIWRGGIWEYGTWKDGIWRGGIWEYGTWIDGTWEGGTWVRGRWENGIWYGGKWYGGWDGDGIYHEPGDSPDKWEE